MSAMPANSEPGHAEMSTALWTGSETIIWGGENDGQYLRSGARFNPAALLVSLPMTNASAARSDHTAVWTGAEMPVWGQFSMAECWAAVPAITRLTTLGPLFPPMARLLPVALTRPCGQGTKWWCGAATYARAKEELPGAGGRYRPSRNTWNQTSTNGAPTSNTLNRRPAAITVLLVDAPWVLI